MLPRVEPKKNLTGTINFSKKQIFGGYVKQIRKNFLKNVRRTLSILKQTININIS